MDSDYSASLQIPSESNGKTDLKIPPPFISVTMFTFIYPSLYSPLCLFTQAWVEPLLLSALLDSPCPSIRPHHPSKVNIYLSIYLSICLSIYLSLQHFYLFNYFFYPGQFLSWYTPTESSQSKYLSFNHIMLLFSFNAESIKWLFVEVYMLKSL